MNNYFSKILAAFLCVFALILSYQTRVEADDTKVPQFIQEYYEEHDMKLANWVWFPFTASSRKPAWPWNWETYIFISNFNDFPITVQVWATNFGEAPTIRPYNLQAFEKKILTLADFGFRNTVADIYLTSGDLMGGAAIIFDADTGDLLTALPPIFF